ncbi:MAG TPA: hypothetical protein GXZ47_04255, partial [Treponema sp.]|nr:hypothetical protein [Treponema sp.]
MKNECKRWIALLTAVLLVFLSVSCDSGSSGNDIPESVLEASSSIFSLIGEYLMVSNPTAGDHPTGMSIIKDNETDYTMTLLNFDTEEGPVLSGTISTEVLSLDPLTVKITAVLIVTEGEISSYGVEGTAIWASGTSLVELPASV